MSKKDKEEGKIPAWQAKGFDSVIQSIEVTASS